LLIRTEAWTGKPVVTSNQTMAWDALPLVRPATGFL
jgi:maleate cis-trans isomerase